MGRIKFFSKTGNEKPKSDMSETFDLDIEGNPETDNETDNEEIKEEEKIEQETEVGDTQSSDIEIEPDEIADADERDEEIATLQNKLIELQDKHLRLAAEYENHRKRTLREKADLIQTAGESLLKNILPVVDDFERGLEAADKADDMDALREGMKLIYNKLNDFLTNNGVKEIAALNEPFDLDWHDAVTNIPAPSEDMKGVILDVIQKGYTLNSKVLRYPKVIVGE